MAAREGSISSLATGSMDSILETFFYGIGQFMFDAAKELLEKEKDRAKTTGSIWSVFLVLMNDFVNAEKLYYTLSFVEKRVLRRDVIRPVYDRLHNEIKKLEVPDNPSSVESPGQDQALLSDLAMQISRFIAARKEMIDFYAKMAKSRWEYRENQEKLVQLIDGISERHSKEFHHPILDSLKSSFCLEVDVAKNLFKAELEMQQWRYCSSLLLLYDCQANLNSWVHLPSPHSTRELSSITTATKGALLQIASKRNRQLPFLYQWLYQMHLAAVSKFSFYFHTTLSSQTNLNEMKLMTAKTSTDYFSKICTFVRKSDAFNVSLILDANSMEQVCSGHGYKLPNIERERPRGMDTYPAIVSLPEPKPVLHWPNVISILTDKSTELAMPGRIVYFYDDQLNSTYYLIKQDVRIYMVVILSSKKKERDSQVQKFMLETRALLCYDRNYQMLKPRQGQKILLK